MEPPPRPSAPQGDTRGTPIATNVIQSAAHWFVLSSTDLLRDPIYRRLWLSILISSFGQQVTMLAVPLTAVLLLHATPTSHLYGTGFFMGCVFVSSGTAAQIVLTQVVPRERLVEAHAKNALASSGAEVIGPGFAGILIKLVGAPLALLADAMLLMFSVSFLRGASGPDLV